MKLADIKSGKPVAMCDWSTLFGFTKRDSAEIVRNEEEGVKEK
jgi:hypothetical protein